MSTLPDPIQAGLERGWKVLGDRHGPLPENLSCDVAIVGSGLADRQQHHAWFEAMIHAAQPDANLTIRNLGFAADEITVQRRSDDVPTTDWFLGMKKGDTTKPGNNGIVYKSGTEFGADVIFAYWGFNESFKGPEGVEAFKRDLDAYLGKLLAAKYNGESAPRVVLFSPIAHENLKSPHFSDGSENNRNLSLYTEAMAAVAKGSMPDNTLACAASTWRTAYPSSTGQPNTTPAAMGSNQRHCARLGQGARASNR
jgi:hypothetical protein